MSRQVDCKLAKKHLYLYYKETKRCRLRCDRCNVVDVSDQDSSLGNNARQHQSTDWFAVLGRHAEEVEERDDTIRSNGLQQPWSSFVDTQSQHIAK